MFVRGNRVKVNVLADSKDSPYWRHAGRGTHEMDHEKGNESKRECDGNFDLTAVHNVL